MTKILAISDIHGDSKLIKRIAERSNKENIDLVIIAGDITLLNKETKNIIKPFAEKNKKVILLHGNHEPISTINQISNSYPNTFNIHNYSIKHENVGIFGAGGADFGSDKMTEYEFWKKLEESHDHIKNLEKKIMITHMHPSGTKSEFTGIKGSKAIRQAIEKFQPDFAIFGHIHEASGIEEIIGSTKLINVSRREKIIEI